MSISTDDELIERTRALMLTAADKATDDTWDQALRQTYNELPWGVPQTDEVKCYWLIERLRRHVVYALSVEAASKFQYKQIHLEHRFKQYFALIENMDKEFKEFVENNPALFPVNTAAFIDAFKYISYIGNGFVYDGVGEAIW